VPSGLQVLNDAGTFQLDENYRNLVFIEKFLFPTQSISHVFTTSGGRVAPVLVLYSTYTTLPRERGIGIMSSQNNGNGTWTFEARGAGEIYVFDVPPAPTVSGAGLQIFNASAQCAFDSEWQAMKIRDYKQVRGHSNFWGFPIQTIGSTGVAGGARNIVEVTPFPSAYAKPTAEKWGWVVLGRYDCFVDLLYQSFSGSSPWGSDDNNQHHGIGAMYASGDNFHMSWRNYDYSGTYVVSSRDPEPGFLFVDITGL